LTKLSVAVLNFSAYLIMNISIILLVLAVFCLSPILGCKSNYRIVQLGISKVLSLSGCSFLTFSTEATFSSLSAYYLINSYFIQFFKIRFTFYFFRWAPSSWSWAKKPISGRLPRVSCRLGQKCHDQLHLKCDDFCQVQPFWYSWLLSSFWHEICLWDTVWFFLWSQILLWP